MSGHPSRRGGEFPPIPSACAPVREAVEVPAAVAGVRLPGGEPRQGRLQVAPGGLPQVGDEPHQVQPPPVFGAGRAEVPFEQRVLPGRVELVVDGEVPLVEEPVPPPAELPIDDADAAAHVQEVRRQQVVVAQARRGVGPQLGLDGGEPVQGRVEVGRKCHAPLPGQAVVVPDHGERAEGAEVRRGRVVVAAAEGLGEAAEGVRSAGVLRGQQLAYHEPGHRRSGTWASTSGPTPAAAAVWAQATSRRRSMPSNSVPAPATRRTNASPPASTR